MDCFKIIDACNEETEGLKSNGEMAMTLYEWLHQSPRNVVQEDYYGNMLNGPNCDKVLKSSTLQAMMDFLPPNLHKFVTALRALDKVPSIIDTNLKGTEEGIPKMWIRLRVDGTYS